MKYGELDQDFAAALKAAKGTKPTQIVPLSSYEILHPPEVAIELPYIDMSTWDSTSAPEREWAVEGRIPMCQPHLTTGHGAIGKSLVELTRAVAHVLGKPWLGMPVRQGPVIYLGCEDDEDEIRRRLESILKYYEATFADVIEGLNLLSYAGKECLLGVPDHKDIIRPTPLFKRIEAEALELGPVTVTIDTLSDVYAGDEIDRNQTTQFVRLLQQLAIRARCSVAILAHPSNAGMASGSGISGSTGWHNKVRSRLYMRAPTTPKGEEIDSDLREITFLKSNYGKYGDSIQIRWKDGVFVPETATNGLEKVAQDHSDDQRFLTLLAKYDGQGRNISHKHAANDYAPRVFGAEKGGISTKRYEQAMQRLFEAGKIQVVSHGAPSRGWTKLVVK